MSKLAMAMLAASLNEIPGVSAVTINPGTVRTGMADAVGLSGKTRRNMRFLRNIMLEPVKYLC